MAPARDKTKNKKPKKNGRYSKEDLQKALIDLREKGKGIRETCRTYGIPRTTIQDRLRGKRCDAIKQKGPDPILGIEGEKRLKEWLITIAKCGFPIKKQELLDTVQKMIKDYGTKNPFKDDRPGQTWYIHFLKRHPDISLRITEGINKAKARVTEESIRTWFNELKTFLAKNNNEDLLECPERIFNVDESGFSLCPETGKVSESFGKGFRNLYQVKAGNEKDNLTVLVTFNANAQVSPPLVIFPYVSPPHAVVENMPEDWCLGKSERGLMSSDVFFEYITKDFTNWVDRNCIQKPILLLVDGHRSHMSLSLSDMCENLGIFLYALPPNTTNMRPADISVFAPLKSSWQTIVRRFLLKTENVNSCVNITNFCRLFRDTLEDTNMDANIKNGFKKCGLFPFNPNVVDFAKCVKTTLENVSKDLRSKSPEITNEDLDLESTRKIPTDEIAAPASMMFPSSSAFILEPNPRNSACLELKLELERLLDTPSPVPQSFSETQDIAEESRYSDSCQSEVQTIIQPEIEVTTTKDRHSRKSQHLPSRRRSRISRPIRRDPNVPNWAYLELKRIATEERKTSVLEKHLQVELKKVSEMKQIKLQLRELNTIMGKISNSLTKIDRPNL